MVKLFKVSKNVTGGEVSGEVIVMPGGDAEKVYVLKNSSAVAIWELLVQGASKKKLVDGLAAQFDVKDNGIEGDVDNFIAQLESNGIIEQKEVEVEEPTELKHDSIEYHPPEIECVNLKELTPKGPIYQGQLKFPTKLDEGYPGGYKYPY